METVVYSVREPIPEIVGSYRSDNQHTLYSLAAKAAIAVGGERPWVLRLPAVIFGVASVPVLYLLGTALASRREAVASALLLAVSYHHVWFSQNARGYTGLLLATLLATWLFVRGYRSLDTSVHVRPTPAGWGRWLAYAATLALGAYMHLTLVFVGLAHGLVLAGEAVRRRRAGESLGPLAAPAGALLLAAVATVLLYAPALPEMARFHLREGRTADWKWTAPSWAAAETARGLRTGFGTFGVAAVALLVGLGTWSYLRRDPAVLALLVLPGALGVAAVLSLGHNIWPRFFFYAAGFALLLLVRGAAVAADALASRMRRDSRKAAQIAFAVLIGTVVTASVASLPPQYRHPKQDYRAALAFVEGRRGPGDRIVAIDEAILAYHLYRPGPVEPVRTAAELERLGADGRDAWLLVTFPIHLQTRAPTLAAVVERRFTPVATFKGTLAGGDVYVLRSRGDAPAVSEATRG